MRPGTAARSVQTATQTTRIGVSSSSRAANTIDTSSQTYCVVAARSRCLCRDDQALSVSHQVIRHRLARLPPCFLIRRPVLVRVFRYVSPKPPSSSSGCFFRSRMPGPPPFRHKPDRYKAVKPLPNWLRSAQLGSFCQIGFDPPNGFVLPIWLRSVDLDVAQSPRRWTKPCSV
jgi:hypothetical protein